MNLLKFLKFKYQIELSKFLKKHYKIFISFKNLLLIRFYKTNKEY